MHEQRKRVSVQRHATGRVASYLKAEQREVDEMRERIADRREELSRRRARLDSARRYLHRDLLGISSSAADVTQAESSSSSTNRSGYKQTLLKMISRLEHAQYDILAPQIHRRRRKLLQTLEKIYPIEVVDPTHLLFSIAAVPLPNSVSSSTRAGMSEKAQGKSKALEALCNDDDTISSALGNVAQLVLLLSAYLSVPLHYQIATAGSRSVIHDPISQIQGPRVFPLYAKGMEGYRFEYAVFLLQKDVEQLLSSQEISVLDIDHMLPNLKNLIVSFVSRDDVPHHHQQPGRKVADARRSITSNRSASTASTATFLAPPLPQHRLRFSENNNIKTLPSSSSIQDRKASLPANHARITPDLREKLGIGDAPVSLKHFVPSTAQGAAESIEQSLAHGSKKQQQQDGKHAQSTKGVGNGEAKQPEEDSRTVSTFSSWLNWSGGSGTSTPKSSEQDTVRSTANGTDAAQTSGNAARTEPPVIRSLGVR